MGLLTSLPLPDTTTALIAAIVFLLSYLLLYRRDRGYVLPPGPPVLPVIGTAYFKPSMAGFLFAKQRYGDVMTFYLGPIRGVCLNSYDAVREALVTKACDFSDRGNYMSFCISAINPNYKGVINRDFDDTLRRNRNDTLMILRNLGVGRSDMEAKILEEAEDLCHHFAEQQQQAFDPWQSVTCSVLNVIFHVFLNKRLQRTDPELTQVLKYTDDVIKAGNHQPYIDAFHCLRHVPPLRATFTRLLVGDDGMREYMWRWAGKLVKQYEPGKDSSYIDCWLNRSDYHNHHPNNNNNNNKYNSINSNSSNNNNNNNNTSSCSSRTGCTSHVSGDTGQSSGDTGHVSGDTGQSSGDTGHVSGDTGQSSGDTGHVSGDTGQSSCDTVPNGGNTGQSNAQAPEFDEENLQYILRDFLLAGSETTTTSIKWTLLFVANRPELQDRVHAEISHVVGSGRQVRLSDRESLPLLEALIWEIQRYNTIVPLGLPHFSKVHSTIGKYDVPPRTFIAANLYAIHMNADVFEKPHDFRPERFIDARGRFVKHAHVIPFGIGKRSCLGELLARQELFLFTATLLQRFRFLPPLGVTSLDERGVLGFTYGPKKFSIRAIPR